MRAFRMKRFVFMLLAVLLVATIVPAAAFAADSTSGAVEVRLKTNSTSVTINGKQSSVLTAPFEKSGTTMVPLSVITKAFGAKLKLQDNKIITLTYNDKKVVVTIGSKTVKVNGKDQTVAVAPVIIKGTTMVPVRVIVEAFGAKIGKDKKTNEIVITGALAQSGNSNSGGSTNIDPDYGKTKVGDSYLGWTMNYPPGLVLANQSDDGTFVIWGNTTSQSSVIVSTEKVTDVLSSNEIRDKITTSWLGDDEVVIDKRTITVNGLNFEKMVTRTTKRGMLFEYRAVQKGDTLYYVMGGVAGSEKTALDPYQSLLDSFVPSFDKADKAVKDITKVVNGLMSINDKDFGLSLKLPAGWYRDTDSTNPSFVSENGYFSFSISSVQGQDTAEQWLARRQQLVHEDFLSNYIRNEKTSSITLKDGNALVLSYDFSYDQKIWYTANEVLLIAGNYRYAIDFNYDSKTGAQGEALFKSTMATIDIDTAYVQANYGQIEDDMDNVDRTNLITKTSSKYGYSISLPAYWLGVDTDFNQESVTYVDNFGHMIIQAVEDTDAATVSRAVQQSLQKEGLTVSGNTSFYVGNSTVIKYSVEDVSSEGLPTTEIFYFVQSKGNTLMFMFGINEANATPSALDRIDSVVKSIKLS